MYKPVKVGKLSEEQCRRLVTGKGVRVTEGQDNVLYLNDRQLKHLDKAFKKGKGVTLFMDPYQAEQHKQIRKGGGLGNSFRKPKEIRKAHTEVFGAGPKQQFKSVGKAFKKTFNKDLGRDIARVGKVAGMHAMQQGIPIATTLASMALGDPTGMSGAALGNIASQYATDAYREDVMKEGKGLFKALHKAGIKNPKKKLISGLKDVAKTASNIGSQMAGEAVTMYTGNPALGQKFAESANSIASSAIEGKLKQGIKQAKSMAKGDLKNYAQNFAIEAIDDYVDKNLTGNEKRLAENLMVGKYPNASEFVYDMANMYTGTDYRQGSGAKRGRRKNGGALYPAGGRRGGALGPAR